MALTPSSASRHTQCGAVYAAYDAIKSGTTLPSNLPSLVEALRPAFNSAQAKNPDFTKEDLIYENVRYVASLVKTNPIFLQANAANPNSVKVVGGVYSLDTGVVEWIDV